MTDSSTSTHRSTARKALHLGSGALLVGVGPAIALMAAAPASASTIVVSNTDNGGAGSLRDAINNAQPGDTIDLTGLSGTISVLQEIAIPTNVTITGPGVDALTISGLNLASGQNLFTVYGGSGLTTFSDVTISGVVDGSAVNCASKPSIDIKLDTVVVSGNAKASGNKSGAGLSADGCGSVEIVDSEFNNNESLYSGGGAYIKTSNIEVNTVTITGSTFDGNTVTTQSSNYYYSSGGGLWVSTYTVDINDSSFTNNDAFYTGAGAFVKAQTVMIDGSDFSLNTASVNSGSGVGVYMSSRGQTSSATISNSSFDANTGYMGGGIYAEDFTTFTISSSSVSGNSTTYKGAGMLLRNDTNNIFNTTIADNAIGNFGGGGAYVTGDTNMAFVTIASNSTTAGAGTTAGLYLHGGTWDINGSIIVDNGDNTNNIKNYNTTATITRSVLGPFTASSISTDATDVLDVADAGLGVLADNGGPTRTMALNANSVAVDRVDQISQNPTQFPGLAYDQRGPGYDRVNGSFADAGAFEYGSVAPTTSTSTTSTTTPSSTTTSTPTTGAPTTLPADGSDTSETSVGNENSASGLPATGTNETPLVAAGAGLLALGAAGAAFAARRRTA
ncbi:hypothetical protein MCETE4_02218 [Acidimicrobiia bacterium]